jgi:signal transduction histidine kinase
MMAATALRFLGKLGALHDAVTMEREVSLPFAPPSPAPARRPIEHAGSAALRLEVASVLEQRADDIAARWWEEARALWSDATITTAEGTSTSPEPARAAPAQALVRALAALLRARDGAGDEVTAHGVALGVSGFAHGVALAQLLRTVQRLSAACLDVAEDVVIGGGEHVAPREATRVCRDLQEAMERVGVDVACGFSEAGDRALRERFRRLRHDLRNPVSTIRSALSLMADETVPEEARRSPRFPAMIERNVAALDQLIVERLNDSAASVLPTSAVRPAEPASAARGGGEPRDDLARPRERDDRQAGSL